MTDRPIEGEESGIDLHKGSREHLEGIAPDVVAKLRAQAEETSAMRRDLYRALQHQHCCCDECLESYRRWFG